MRLNQASRKFTRRIQDNLGGGGYILELNNFLNFKDSMNESILVPMHERCNGMILDDIPKICVIMEFLHKKMFRPDECLLSPLNLMIRFFIFGIDSL